MQGYYRKIEGDDAQMMMNLDKAIIDAEENHVENLPVLSILGFFLFRTVVYY
jgi:hypothetical protein